MASTNDSRRTGYLFFLEWEYYKRRDFLLQWDQLKELHKKSAREGRERHKNEDGVQCYLKLDIEEALKEIYQEREFGKSKSYERFIDEFLNDYTIADYLLDRFLVIYTKNSPNRLQKNSRELLEEFLNNNITLDNLIYYSPNGFRRQYHKGTIYKDNDGNIHPVKKITAETDQLLNIDHEVKFLRSMTNEVNNSKREDDERRSLIPNKSYYMFPCNHDKLASLANISTKKKKMDLDKLKFHLIGLCIWDMQINNPSVETRSIIRSLIEEHPDLPEANEHDLTPDIMDYFYKCYKSTKDSIGHTNLLPF